MALTSVVAVIVVDAASALGGIDNWSASVGKIAVGSGFDPSGSGGGGPSARPSERIRESSRLASTFGVATAPASSTQPVGTTGGVLETTDPLAIDAFASSGFGALPSVPTFACWSTRDCDTSVRVWTCTCVYAQGIRLLPLSEAIVMQLRRRRLGRLAKSVRKIVTAIAAVVEPKFKSWWTYILGCCANHHFSRSFPCYLRALLSLNKFLRPSQNAAGSQRRHSQHLR